MLTERVGESLKNYRELRKITREDMADQLGMTVSGYGKLLEKIWRINWE